MTHRIAIYPGTFDPITMGHVDIIKRASLLVDELIIGVAVDSSKTPVFSLDKRVKMVQNDVVELFSKEMSSKIKVIGFEGLVVKFAQDHGAKMLIRGLRAVSDFEYEFQMACVNGKIDSDMQTIFLPASESTHFIASRFVKNVAKLGGDVTNMVSSNVKKELDDFYNKSV